MKVIQPAHVPEPRTGFRPREYAHIVFRTRQPEALIDWYCKVLGMHVVMRHDIINFLTWDSSQDRLAIVPSKDASPRPQNAVGLHHAAFQVGTLRELTAQYRHLRSIGIEPIRCMNHGVATSMYYVDPDGNQIELTVEAFDDRETLNNWLATGAFDENPIGVSYDAEELCARVDAGEAEHQILRPAPDHARRLHEVLNQPKETS